MAAVGKGRYRIGPQRVKKPQKPQCHHDTFTVRSKSLTKLPRTLNCKANQLTGPLIGDTFIVISLMYQQI